METYTLKLGRAVAFGSPTSGGNRPGFVVRAGSTAIKIGAAKIRRDDPLRDRLLRTGTLVDSKSDPALYVFSRDFEFKSASNAGGIINDGNLSGPERWLNAETGSSLKDDLAQRTADLAPQRSAKRAEELWSDDELREALLAYKQVLQWEATGVEFSPTKLHRDLIQTKLPRRTEGSVARRMSNISAALQKVGRPHAERYKPSFEHVGTGIRSRMLSIWEDINDLGPTADPGELALRTRRAQKAIAAKPAGQQSPEVTSTQVTTYVRDPKVQAWVLNASAGLCEGCGERAPFNRADGEPYLEVHHVWHLAEGGPDTVENTVAVCPNCHRRLHYGEDRAPFRGSLYDRVSRLVSLG